MRIFSPLRRKFDPDSARTWAWFEIVYTTVDFVAAILFLTGAILSFGDETRHAAAWFFLFGSVLFATKPTLRLVREIWFLRQGDDSVLARRSARNLEIGHDDEGRKL